MTAIEDLKDSRPLSRDDILKSVDLPTDTIHIPRWGGTVLVKGMPTGHPRYILYWGGRHNENLSPDEKQVRKYIGAAIMSALDPETREPMFDWKDADELRTHHYNSVLMVANRAFQLAANTEDEERQLVIQSLLRVIAYTEQEEWAAPHQTALEAIFGHIAEELTGGPAAEDEDPLADPPESEPTSSS